MVIGLGVRGVVPGEEGIGGRVGSWEEGGGGMEMKWGGGEEKGRAGEEGRGDEKGTVGERGVGGGM